MRPGLTGPVSSILDSSFAAAANLLAGLLAIRVLSTQGLALYALLFSAAVAAMLVPSQMVYFVQRLDLNRRPPGALIPLRTSAARSTLHVIVVVAVTLASGLPILIDSGDPALWLIGLSAAAWAAISPLQDHVRAQLHIAGRHSLATTASVVNFSVTVCTLFLALVVTGLGTYLLPFGALFASNLISIAVAMLVSRNMPRIIDDWQVNWMTGVLTSLPAFLLQCAAYFTNVVVLVLLSEQALAQLEAARVAAQPVFAIAVGLLGYFGPRLIRADAAGDKVAVRRALAQFSVTLGAFTSVLAALLVGFPGFIAVVLGRPFDGLLAAARSVSFAARASSNVVELMALGRRAYRRIIAVSAIAAILSIALVPLLVPLIGVYSVPVALTAASATRFLALSSHGRGRSRD